MTYTKLIFITSLILGLVLFPVTVSILIAVHLYLYICNPYSRFGIFKSPYATQFDGKKITYNENYQLKVYTSRFADWLGYYRSGLLIVANTIFGGARVEGRTSDEIIAEIHRRRFDPARPYLISGDQFSVLYPRNLGVFYNQLIDRNSALNEQDYHNRLRIYLQSVLFAIDGLSAGDEPRTTIVPIGLRSVALTQVHPGGVGSDQVYGLLYAIEKLHDEPLTHAAAEQLLEEKHAQLLHILNVYLDRVVDHQTKMIKAGLHLASARDGVVRSSSMYDNIVLWKTLQLADKLGIQTSSDLNALRTSIKKTYWNKKAHHYNDDLQIDSFSSDILIGYVTGFFDLTNKTDLERTSMMIEYIESSGLADPFPIKYQVQSGHEVPLFVKWFVPNYGSSAIWSYWGAQYITLLIDMYEKTGQKQYLVSARTYADIYKSNILRDGGFAETFDESGRFMQRGVYKSIRVTGWIVQYEHAAARLRKIK